MKIRILTWNTCCDPTMHGRLARINSLHEFILKHRDSLDIILLQEMSSFRAGPLSFFMYKILKALFPGLPLLFLILDYLMMFEGLLLPLFVVDLSGATVKFLKDIGYIHTFTDKAPGYYMNSGLVIASRYKLTNTMAIPLKSDIIHKPGVLITTIKTGRTSFSLANCHLVPSLGNQTVPYRICNFINSVAGKNTCKIREESLYTIKDHIIHNPALIAGDMNIDRNNREEYLRMNKILGTKSVVDKPVPTHYEGDKGKHIDYILIKGGFKARGWNVPDDVLISDHYPLTADLILKS